MSIDQYTSAATLPIPLGARPDLSLLAARFSERRRVVIENVLEPVFAESLRQRMLEWEQWALVTIAGGRHRNFDSAQMDLLAPGQWVELEELVGAQAREGMQYLYERYPLLDPDYRHLPADPVVRRARDMLAAPAFVELMHAVTGSERIAFADAQMTRYRRGHFLTLHDDHAEGKNRIAAYVLSLTRDWPADYGGQLQFIGVDGRVDEVLIPRFNTLAVFEVPVPHLVSAVAPFVKASRLSITGWLRW